MGGGWPEETGASGGRLGFPTKGGWPGREIEEGGCGAGEGIGRGARREWCGWGDWARPAPHSRRWHGAHAAGGERVILHIESVRPANTGAARAHRSLAIQSHRAVKTSSETASKHPTPETKSKIGLPKIERPTKPAIEGALW